MCRTDELKKPKRVLEVSKEGVPQASICSVAKRELPARPRCARLWLKAARF
jgi:hypothetical protein